MADRKLGEILAAYERGYERGMADAFQRAAAVVEAVGKNLMSSPDLRLHGIDKTGIGHSFTVLVAGLRDLANPEPAEGDDE